MKSAFLILACASGCLATGARGEDPQQDPTGLWKQFTLDRFTHQVLPGHPIIALAYKDGRLTGRRITGGFRTFEQDDPLNSPTFKDGVVSFLAPVGMTSFEGRLMGGVIIGKMTVNNPPRFGGGGGRGGGGRGGGGGGGVYEVTWVLARITPAGIWDLKMGDLTLAGQPWDSGDPLHSITDFMKFEYKDLMVTGAWKRGPGQPELIKSVSFVPYGITFSVSVETPSGNIVYDFAGEFVGTFAPDAVEKMPMVFFDGPGRAHVDDPGASLDMIDGTVKITAPNGQAYKSKWRLTRDNGDHARVEIGTPYEVPAPAPPAGKP